MTRLQPPEMLHVNAARGWLELGNCLEANAELDGVTSSFFLHPEVLELRWQICFKAKMWKECLDIATTLVEITPDRVSSWIYRACAIRRVNGGGLTAAKECLLVAFEIFPKDLAICYDLACCTCQLGDLKAAREWLEKVFELDDSKALELMAMNSPELEPLWADMGTNTPSDATGS